MTDARRTELKAFLRAKRGRIDPESVGLPHVQRRRRTAGLRIEEAAAVAGVSLTWYSAFERGSEIRVSEDVLSRIAHLLRLTPEEKAYLRELTSPAPPGDDGRERFDAAIEQRTVDAFTAGAAFITDSFWNISAFNAVADALYGFGDADEINLLVRMYQDATLRALHVEWDRIVTQMTDIFHCAYGNHVDDPRANVLLGKLRAKTEFAQRWESYSMRDYTPTTAKLRHPTFGELTLSYSSYVAAPPGGSARRVLIVQTAIDEPSARALASIGSTPG